MINSFQNKIVASFACVFCAHLNNTASGVVASTPHTAIIVPFRCRARSLKFPSSASVIFFFGTTIDELGLSSKTTALVDLRASDGRKNLVGSHETRT